MTSFGMSTTHLYSSDPDPGTGTIFDLDFSKVEPVSGGDYLKKSQELLFLNRLS